jgi:DNA-binding CsgD family transcriptional regulator
MNATDMRTPPPVNRAGGDERTAMLLENVSTIARGSSGYAAAAAALEHAAEISSIGRTRRLYLAAADAQLAGDERLARSLLARADGAAAASSTGARYCRSVAAAVVARASGALRTGSAATAREILAASVDSLRATGATRAMPEVMSLLATAQASSGDLAGAQATAQTALSLATLTGDEAEFPALCTLALVGALRGDAEQARSFTRRAVELADGEDARRGSAAEAEIMLDLGAGRHDEVIRRWAPTGPAEILPDVLEAMVRAGYTLASVQVDRLRDLRLTAPPPLAAAAWRVLGLAAGADRFAACFERALTLHENMDLPFARARVLLAFGERLRRAGRRVAARTHLNEAYVIFSRMGADPWTATAMREITVTDAGPEPVTCPIRPKLTRQEYEVARTVATGATNRQAAARLFVSVKTVEFHLGNIFRKLEISNRTQLSRMFAHPAPGQR